MGEVGETLWEVAAHLAGVGVVFLGKETKVIAGPQSPFKRLTSILQLTLVGQALHNLAEIRQRALAALHHRQIKVLAIAEQSSDGNLSMLVAQQDANQALTLLHQEFQLGQALSEELAVKTV